MTTAKNYERFEFPPEHLVKYISAAGIFTIYLTDKSVTHFTPDDPEDFRAWLEANNVPDIRV